MERKEGSRECSCTCVYVCMEEIDHPAGCIEEQYNGDDDDDGCGGSRGGVGTCKIGRQ